MRDFTDGHILYEEGNYVFVPAYLFDVSVCHMTRSYIGDNVYALTISFGWQDAVENISYEQLVEDSNKDGVLHIDKILKQITEAFNIKEDRFDPKPCIIIIDKSNMIDVCGIEQFRSLDTRKRIMFSEISEGKE
ncbi:MAG: hypothetical protein RBT65_09760 [Methanolobus sp.]|nr:hypothetical protein [Methanolobus sp.]